MAPPHFTATRSTSRLPNPTRFKLVVVCILAATVAGCSGSAFVPAGPKTIQLGQLLTQLDALPLPAGADQAQFENLRSSMRNYLLSSDKTRWTAAAPADAANKVADLGVFKVDDFSANAVWTYRNVGDYDQNSEVNVADLSSLGSNLNKNTVSPDWAKAQVADGDRNGEINVSDLTPLGSHLTNSVDAYAVQFTDTPAAEASWADAAMVPLLLATPATDGPRRFAWPVAAELGQWFRVVPMSAGARGIPSDPVEYTGAAVPAISFADRSAILALIADKFANLTATTSEGQDQELGDYIATLPFIDDAGNFEGNAWGRFTDGRELVVCKNHAPAGHAPAALRREESHSKVVSGFGLPYGDGGNCLWGYGPGTTYTDPTSQLATILNSYGGYDSYSGEAEMLTLRANPDDAFLYLDSPAGLSMGKDGVQTYWIGTSESVGLISEDSLLGDFDNHRVAYVFAINASGVGQWQYGFGSRFVEYYMSFSKNSFVFLNTPMSGTATDMISAFQSVGASLVLGWYTCVSNDVSYAGAIHLIDRVLGANELGRDEDPNIRPFPLQETLFDMQARGVSAGQPIYYPLTPPNPYDSLIRFYSFNPSFDNFDQFVPSIMYMQVNINSTADDDQLEIYGDFGDDPARGDPTVYISNGSPLVVRSHDESQIVCDLPETGANSYGDVQVAIGTWHFSNTRQLTEWRGTINYSSVGPGTLTHSVTYNLHLRADLNSYRTLPETDPLLFGLAGDGVVPLICAPDSYATVDSSGTYNDGATIESWSNSGSTRVNNIYGFAAGDYMTFGGNLDVKTDQLTFIMPTLGPYHQHTENIDGTNPQDADTSLYVDISAVAPAPNTLKLSYEPNTSSILGGQSQRQDQNTLHTVTWETWFAQSGPDMNAPR